MISNHSLCSIQVPAEYYEAVTVYFSDIVGFTEIAAENTPLEVKFLHYISITVIPDFIFTSSVYRLGCHLPEFDLQIIRCPHRMLRRVQS